MLKRIMAALGLAMLVSGIITIVWGGMLLKLNWVATVGLVIAMIGISLLMRVD